MQENDLLREILNNTKEINTKLSTIEKTQKEHGDRLQYIEKNHGERLQHIEKSHGERLQSIENIVTRMEKEHGERIQVLFDYFTDQDQKYKETISQIRKLQEKSDSHDTRLFALEFYKEEKLASK